MSDHEPLFIHAMMSNGSHRRTPRCLFNFTNMEKESILKALAEYTFTPYCWKNSARLVKHWHEWVEPKLETFFPRKTVEPMSEENLYEYQDNLFTGRLTEKIFRHLKRVEWGTYSTACIEISRPENQTSARKGQHVQ